MGLVTSATRRAVRSNAKKIVVVLCLLMLTVPLVHADGDDLDPYHWRVTALWWFSKPTGSFTSSSGSWDLHRDFDFLSYSTFTGSLDWRFKRKHHFILSSSPVQSTRTVDIARTITYRGVTYNVGTRVSAKLTSLSLNPGYQWDFFRRDHGYIALSTQIYLLNNRGALTGTATVNGIAATRTVSGSILAPLPVIGVRTRWYPLHDSSRLVFDGGFQGLYFFGYGNFIAANGRVGVGVTNRLKLTAGYQLGNRFTLKGKSNQLGVHLTQQGPTAGLEFSW